MGAKMTKAALIRYERKLRSEARAKEKARVKRNAARRAKTKSKRKTSKKRGYSDRLITLIIIAMQNAPDGYW